MAFKHAIPPPAAKTSACTNKVSVKSGDPHWEAGTAGPNLLEKEKAVAMDKAAQMAAVETILPGRSCPRTFLMNSGLERSGSITLLLRRTGGKRGPRDSRPFPQRDRLERQLAWLRAASSQVPRRRPQTRTRLRFPYCEFR